MTFKTLLKLFLIIFLNPISHIPPRCGLEEAEQKLILAIDVTLLLPQARYGFYVHLRLAEWTTSYKTDITMTEETHHRECHSYYIATFVISSVILDMLIFNIDLHIQYPWWL